MERGNKADWTGEKGGRQVSGGKGGEEEGRKGEGMERNRWERKDMKGKKK